MKKISIVMLSLLISFVSLNLTNAQPRMNKKHHGFDRQNFIKQLNLTDAQLKQFHKFQYESQDQAIDLRAQIQKKRLQIKNMMVNENINGSELLALTNQISDLQAKIKESKIKTWLNIYKILNKDQQKIWLKHFKMMGKNFWGEMRGRFIGKRDFKGMREFRNFPPLRDDD